MAEIEKDQVTGTDTTGHVWDGIKELNTPLPRWWLYTFYATAIWAVLYTIAYPAWPLISSATTGILGYSSRGELADEMAAAKAKQAKSIKQIADLPLAEIVKRKDLLSFAVAGGRSAFAVNCVQCHGSGAAGAPSYPNLNDDDWLWGGDVKSIYQTIAHGIRFDEDDDSRSSSMPKFLSDEVLTAAQISDVAEFVMSLSNNAKDQAAVGRGAPLFKENCVACHGENGKGDREQGAAKLNDAIWLFGGSKAQIIETISYSRNGVMPAWAHRLDDVTVKQLALYVHSLGGGE